MKKIGLVFFTLSIFTSTAVVASDKQGTSRVGVNGDDVPCTCVFNKNRMWNPEKVLWNNAYWKCSNYQNDGTCSEVSKIKDIEQEREVHKDNKAELKSSEKTSIDAKVIGDYQIVFNNGDILSGTIQNHTLLVKSSYGTVSIKMADIVTINFEKSVCKIMLKNGDKLTGTIQDNIIEFKLSGKTPINIKMSVIKSITNSGD